MREMLQRLPKSHPATISLLLSLQVHFPFLLSLSAVHIEDDFDEDTQMFVYDVFLFLFLIFWNKQASFIVQGPPEEEIC